MTGQQVYHHAFMVWIEMLDQNEGHAASRGQRVREHPARLQAAGRGAYFQPPESSRARKGVRGPVRSAAAFAFWVLWLDVLCFRTCYPAFGGWVLTGRDAVLRVNMDRLVTAVEAILTCVSQSAPYGVAHVV